MDAVLALAQKASFVGDRGRRVRLWRFYRGRHAGTFGRRGVLVFILAKASRPCEGGMITTQRDDLMRLSRCLRDHGASRTDLARHEGSKAFLLADYNHLGFNFRMTDIQGALGARKWIALTTF